ncbi:MAG: hypothetical protein CSA79_00470 [Thiothrix nivea]|nr:MAG: hypothetical protein CSA79_00470 [Thiothrix nivea]
MKKTFTVHSFYHKEVSPGKGSVTWLLSDEQGVPRKVSGVTDIDEEGVIAAIHPVYQRETPLVERLYAAEKGDRFTIDFTAFNQREGYKPRQVYHDMQTREQVAGLAANIRKYLLVVGAVALLWFTYTALTDVAIMELNFLQ